MVQVDNMRLGAIFLFWFPSVFTASHVSAMSIVVPLVSESETVGIVHDIVEGEVVYVARQSPPVSMPAEYACVDPVYKLKVTGSLKGKYSAGDLLSVGVNRAGQSVVQGGRQLAVINKLSEFFEGCWFDELDGRFSRNDLVIPNTVHVGMFNVFFSPDGEKMFRAESCERNPQFMFEREFAALGYRVKEEKRGDLDCAVLVGPYDRLYEKISGEVEKLQVLEVQSSEDAK